jgi:hypothetical protein
VHTVPNGLLSALLAAVPDDNAYIGIEALYAFGTLAVDAAGPARIELLRAAAPEFAAFVGAAEPEQRIAALRVAGHVFARRADDLPVDEARRCGCAGFERPEWLSAPSQCRAWRDALRASGSGVDRVAPAFRSGAVADEPDALARTGSASRSDDRRARHGHGGKEAIGDRRAGAHGRRPGAAGDRESLGRPNESRHRAVRAVARGL